MKKIYEAPKMLVEVVCVEELLSESSFKIHDGADDTKVEKEADILTKDLNSGDWGSLW